MDTTENKIYDSPKKSVWPSVAIFAVAAVAILIPLYFFVFAGKSTNSSPVVASNGTQQISVNGSDFSFDPSTITVKVGQSVTIAFKNTGSYPHNLVIGDLNVGTKTIQSGETDTVTFTPDKVGNYTFTCTVPGHADRGMVGNLVVQ